MYQLFPLIFVIYLTDHNLFQKFITVVWFDLTNIHHDLFFLGEFVQILKISRQTSDLRRHTVLDILPICIQVFHDFTSE